MARTGHASVSRTVMVEGGKIYVRMTYDGVWMISFEPDKEQYPDVQGGVVEHTPRGGEDDLDEVISWVRGEWARRLRAASCD
jgi:hypothetical protein